MADFITAVLFSCKVKRCAKMDHESLKLTIRYLYNPDGKAGQIGPGNFPCKWDYNSGVCLPQGIYLSEEEGDAFGKWTTEREENPTTSTASEGIECKYRSLNVCTKRLLGVLDERILQATKNQDCSMKASLEAEEHISKLEK